MQFLQGQRFGIHMAWQITDLLDCTAIASAWGTAMGSALAGGWESCCIPENLLLNNFIKTEKTSFKVFLDGEQFWILR